MKVLIGAGNADSAHDVAAAARHLFPDAEHLVVGAIESMSYLLAEPIGGGAIPVTPNQHMMERAQQRTDEAVEAAKTELGTEAEDVVEIGEPGHVICEQARAHGVDVIVVGRSSKGWLSRLFDPSVSEYVVRHAPCPVLVVREQADGAQDESSSSG